MARRGIAMPLAPTRKRFWRGPRVGITAVVVVSAAVALLVWSNRPRWHTAVSPVIPGLSVAVSVEYPDGWKQLGYTDSNRGWINWDSETEGIFVRQPPHGLSRWLREHLFHEDFAGSEPDYFMVVLRVEDYGIGDYLNPSSRLSGRRFQHRLGPAFEQYYVSGPIQAERAVTIICKDLARHRRMNLHILTDGSKGLPRLPEFEEVVRRLRLVPGK
jgi:hypothetical protein